MRQSGLDMQTGIFNIDPLFVFFRAEWPTVDSFSPRVTSLSYFVIALFPHAEYDFDIILWCETI